jgi:hypothetical protein
VYGTVKSVFFGFILLLIGMTIGGDGHQAGSVIGHIFGPLFGHPFISAVLIGGIAVGVWIGREGTVDQLGEYEKAGIRKAIETGGDRFKE